LPELQPIKAPANNDFTTPPPDASAIPPSPPRAKSAALIMNQNDHDYLIDLPDVSSLLSTMENLGLHSPVYNFLEAVVNSKNVEVLVGNVEEYDAGDHGVGVNNTDCVVCNYGSSGDVNDYIPANLGGGQCVGLNQCGRTVNETITIAGDSLTARGVEDSTFSSRLADRLTTSDTILAGGGSSHAFQDLQGLMKAVQRQVGWC